MGTKRFASGSDSIKEKLIAIVARDRLAIFPRRGNDEMAPYLHLAELSGAAVTVQRLMVASFGACGVAIASTKEGRSIDQFASEEKRQIVARTRHTSYLVSVPFGASNRCLS